MQLSNYYIFVGNLYACPFGKRLSDCPIFPVVLNTFRERYEWFDNLSIEERESVVEYHNQCLTKRENSENY